jgi:hypothetical protein
VLVRGRVQVADQFLVPIPQILLKDPEAAEWARALHLLLDSITAADGAIATGEATTEVVLTQQEKLDKITVTQDVNLDTMEADTATNKAAIDLIATGSPDYNISNDGTVRTLNADAAAGSISVSPTQAQVENLRDAQLNSDDVLATFIRDNAAKGIVGV